MKYYVVKKGRQTGIFTEPWETVKQLVDKFPGASYKSFTNYAEAQKWFYGQETSIQEALLSSSPPLTADVPLPPPTTIIYTDGSCIDEKGGYGIVIVKPDGTHTCHNGKVPHSPCTNNIAELYAIKMALNLSNERDLIIKTDSKYSIGCLTEWIHTWKRNDWLTSNQEPVKNKDLIETIELLCNGRKIKYEWVRGHNGDQFNEICDKLAKAGTEL